VRIDARQREDDADGRPQAGDGGAPGVNGSREIAIVGVYATRQQKKSGRTAVSLMMEAMRGALDDAGIPLSEVDGYIYYHFPAGNGLGFDDGAIAEQFGHPMGITAQTSGAKAVLLAGAAIRAGLAKVVVIPASGAQSLAGDMATYTRPTHEFTEWTGSMTPAQYAIMARRYMHEYGATIEQMAEVAANSHYNASLNPQAVRFGQELQTRDLILNGRMIADPLTQPMCSLVNDGGSCIVVTSAERAKDCRHPPVWVVGGAAESHGNSYFEAPSLRMLGTRHLMLDGFSRAGVRHDDIDMVMCYDHFAHGPMLQFETLGFCETGEGGAYVPGVIGLDGAHPSSADGGNLAYSHNGVPYNFKQIEIVKQFRNEVEDLCPGWAKGEHTYDRRICRKVRDPKLSVACGPLTDARHAFNILAKD
jgi:acetyl-CoA acetyltransferase